MVAEMAPVERLVRPRGAGKQQYVSFFRLLGVQYPPPLLVSARQHRMPSIGWWRVATSRHAQLVARLHSPIEW